MGRGCQIQPTYKSYLSMSAAGAAVLPATFILLKVFPAAAKMPNGYIDPYRWTSYALLLALAALTSATVMSVYQAQALRASLGLRWWATTQVFAGRLFSFSFWVILGVFFGQCIMIVILSLIH
jgi:hypothetical protein